jgi:hypothetical protein
MMLIFNTFLLARLGNEKERNENWRFSFLTNQHICLLNGAKPIRTRKSALLPVKLSHVCQCECYGRNNALEGPGFHFLIYFN